MTVEHGVIPGRAFARAARLRGIARFLLAESPAEGEALAYVPKEVLEVFACGNGVVRFEGPGAGTRYMVVRDGTRFLCPSLPADVDESSVRTVGPPDRTGRRLLRRFRRGVRRVGELAPVVHQSFRLDEIRAALEREYPRKRANPPDQVLPLLLLVHPGAPAIPSTLGILEPDTEDWLQAAIDHLKREYALCNASGDVVREMLAVLMYLRLSPDPARRIALSALDAGFAHPRFDIGAGRSADARPWVPGPNLDLQLITGGLSIPELAIPARQLALLLARTADEQVARARHAPSLELFQGQLYGALLAYRTAQRVFVALERVFGPFAHDPLVGKLLDRKALETRARHCEEMRVHIFQSLAMAAGLQPHALDLANPRSTMGFLVRLSRTPLREAERDLTDLSIRLCIPDFVRRMFKAWLWIFHPGSDGSLAVRGTRSLKEVVSFLEPYAAANVLYGEPAFVALACNWLAGEASRRGARGEAREWAKRVRSPRHRHFSFEAAFAQTEAAIASLSAD